MSGGVAGEAGRPVPLCRSGADLRYVPLCNGMPTCGKNYTTYTKVP